MKYLRPAVIFALAYFAAATNTFAQTVVANTIIRSRTIISASDLVVSPKNTPGALQVVAQVVGLEARSMIYPGRPIMPANVGPPSVIKRNEIVTLIYQKGALLISTEGRALARGGIGDRIRVMNLASRTTVSGTITQPGEIRIMP